MTENGPEGEWDVRIYGMYWYPLLKHIPRRFAQRQWFSSTKHQEQDYEVICLSV